jgi:hypothetical protein
MDRPDITNKLAKSLGAKAVTVQELAEILKKHCKGATFASAIIDTEPKMRKTDNPYYGRVRKINRISGILNFNYDEGVRRRLEKEGKNPDEFVGGSSWHKPVTVDGKFTPLAAHKDNPDQLYLRVAVQHTDKPEYFFDGKPIDKKQIESFIPERSHYQNQNLEEPYRFIAPSLNNVREINIGGEKYIIKD